MCCLFSILVFLGPRVGLIFWFIADRARFDRVFDGWFLPVLGWLVLPWTTLMYVAIGINGIDGFEWVWIGLGVLADLATYAGGGWRNKDQINEYSTKYVPR